MHLGNLKVLSSKVLPLFNYLNFDTYLSLQHSSMKDNNFPEDIGIAGSTLAISPVYSR